jgi:hypothetical protein
MHAQYLYMYRYHDERSPDLGLFKKCNVNS